MGLDSRRPPLPAPTDISSSAIGNTSDDLATDVSRRTDRTSYSIPEDGSPVTINTKKIQSQSQRDKELSQTSLLIEYFEGGKTGPGVNSRPSVRVRVTPSGSKKSRSANNDYIQLTESGKNRKPSYTRRISLPRGSDDPLIPSNDSDVSSTRPPVEVEVLQNYSDISDDYSPVRSVVPPSDISSMPADSLLGSTPVIYSPQKRSSTTIDRGVTMDTLKPSPSRQRSLSRERLVQKTVKKVQERSSGKESSSKAKSSSRRSSRSDSREYILDETSSPKTRSSKSKYRDDDHLGVQASEVSTMSALSDRSAGQHSVRSGTSTASINNPKLLSAVEDAIKRLILPELNALKEEQKTQKNRYKFEEITRDSMAPAGSRENLRRVSKSSSSPNVSGKPGIVSDDRGVILPADSVKGKKSRRSSRGSERSHDTAIREESRKSSREKRHGDKALAAAALAGAGLTAAALRHHDSVSSLDYDREMEREKRKRHTKSRSRSASVSESVEEVTHKEHIPPLPMQSTLETDLGTRDSILSVDTDRPASRSSRGVITPVREIREVARGSPRQVVSPTPQTPTKSPLSMRHGTSTYQESRSPGAFSPVSTKSDRGISSNTKAGLAAAGVIGAGLLAADHAHSGRSREHTPTRDVSPVQSAASYQDHDEVAEHERVRQIRSTESLPTRKAHKKRSNLSIDSLSSSPTTNLAQSKKRPEGISLERGYEIMPEHDQTAEDEEFFHHGHAENERYRHELEEESQLGSSVADINRRDTTYTDNSVDWDHGDRSLDDHDIRGVGANPEYVRTPVAVESAVASLHEPSILSVQSSAVSASVKDHPDSTSRGFDNSMAEFPSASSRERWETIRDQAIENARQQSSTASPHQSKTSLEDRPVMGASALPLADDAMPEIGHGFDEGSEVTTNPSIIQGPIGGGFDHEDRSHWPYDPTPNLANEKQPDSHHTRDAALLGAAGAAAVGLGLAAHNNNKSKEYAARNLGPTMEAVEDEHNWQGNVGRSRDPMSSPPTNPFGYSSPAANKIDEGYMSNTVPGGELTPDPYAANRDFDNQSFEQYEEEDPFTTQKHLRHESGLSAGMASPLYDGATGKGIDRIQSKDVVALMDHLTVRDAQRNARDTEILVTLVRSAAEMRNQFEDMKKHIAEQDRLIMQNSDKNADVTVQRVLGGPRQMPASNSPRGARRQLSDDGDEYSKKQSKLTRALRGLGLKSNNDLGKIEGMLMQLLDEVEGLKEAQLHGSQRPATNNNTRSNSLDSYENLRAAPDPGYEPEGQAGTSSSPTQSGHLSNTSSKYLNGMHSGYDSRRVSEGHRISTVLEGDEEGEDWTPNSAPQLREYDDERNLTPTQELRRGNSLPLDTPPDQTAQFQNSYSAEQTPKTDKSRKHKSNTSSLFGGFPKISRWSKTTASTERDAETARNSKRNTRPYSEISRSGSNLNLPYNEEDDYSFNEEDRLHSPSSFHDRGMTTQARSPSPLITDAERHSMEDPKYQAHRNSLNLQHPQPRPGPTHRHQTYLESQAVNYENPPTPDQDQWGNTPALALNRNRFSAGSAQTAQTNLSPVYSDGGEDAYSQHSASEQAHNRLPPQLQAAQGPPRPPKVKSDEGPLLPPKVPLDDENSKPDSGGVPGMGYSSPFSNSGMHIASPLEPIAEVRYSLETDRGSGGRQVSLFSTLFRSW
jgi:hypothetical protein